MCIRDRLRADNISVIFISHRWDEVYAKCDRISVLKDGVYVGTYGVNELSQLELLSKMIGNKDLQMDKRREHRDFSDAPVIL